MMRQVAFSHLVVSAAVCGLVFCAMGLADPPTGEPQALAADDVTDDVEVDTYVYILGGIDPFHCAGMPCVAEQIRCHGYANTRFGGWYQARQFERDIRCLHDCCPRARIVLIGYSAGAYAVRGLANRLVRDGVPVALVGYVGADYLRDTDDSRVLGMGRVVNVTGDGFLLTGRNLFFNGTTLSGATNLHLQGTRHFGLPREALAIDTLLEEIDAVTATAARREPRPAQAVSRMP